MHFKVTLQIMTEEPFIINFKINFNIFRYKIIVFWKIFLNNKMAEEVRSI
jgi:hypothetical protein